MDKTTFTFIILASDIKSQQDGVQTMTPNVASYAICLHLSDESINPLNTIHKNIKSSPLNTILQSSVIHHYPPSNIKHGVQFLESSIYQGWQKFHRNEKRSMSALNNKRVYNIMDVQYTT